MLANSHLLDEARVEEAAVADRSHDVAQSSLFRAFEIRLQLHDLQARFFKLVPDVVELIAHVAIVLDEGQYDLLDRANRFVARQALVVAIEPLGKAIVVGHMGLQHLCHLAQNPVDLFVLVTLVGRVSPRHRDRFTALDWNGRGLDRQTPERDAQPAKQEQLQERSRARNQGSQGAERLVRNKGFQRRQRDGANEDSDERVNRVDL
jgi:hypothetical protein